MSDKKYIFETDDASFVCPICWQRVKKHDLDTIAYHFSLVLRDSLDKGFNPWAQQPISALQPAKDES